MSFRYIFIGLLIILFQSVLIGQDHKTLKKVGDQYFEDGNYREALTALQNYQDYKPNDIENLLKIGICQYFINDVNRAKNSLQFVIDHHKKEIPDAYFYLGRCYQATLDFEQAILLYKSFLRATDQQNINRPLVKDAILRSAYGLRNAVEDKTVIVENMGKKVNSIDDDFLPVLSPNFMDKMYFSSTRVGNIGGKINPEGVRDIRKGEYKSDIFSTEIINGEWSATQRLSLLLNTTRNDIALDISDQGDALYYFVGPTNYSGEIFVDTFQQNPQADRKFHQFNGPIRAERGDKGLYFFNDSILLFSSRRAGGYGGMDLYISKKSHGKWLAGINLGSTINTAYDEVSPFLALDGRTLYYSTNYPHRSLGGLDIVKSMYNDSKESWSEPINLKIPINSAGDDNDFKITKDGLSSFFTSSRKNGFGKNDIYITYFTQKMKENLKSSDPLTFFDIQLRKIHSDSLEQNNFDPENLLGELPIQYFELASLSYEEGKPVINLQNKNKLQKVVDISNQFPNVKWLISTHSDGSNPKEFDLFFSIKKSEEVIDFLVSQGLKSEQLVAIGLGSSYALIDTNKYPNGQRYNRRVVIQAIYDKELSLAINYLENTIQGTEKPMSLVFYNRASKGISFRVKIAELGQMYKGDVLTSYPNGVVIKDNDNENYLYYVGLYRTYISAATLATELKSKGLSQIEVVAFLDGQMLNQNDIISLVEQYPELNKLIK